MQPFRIDVHHHSVPGIFVDEMNRQQYVPSHGAGFPDWSAQSSLDMMEQFGIAAAITSVSSPGVFVGNEESAVALSRKLNEYSARMVSDHADRLGYFAILPMPLSEAAVKEAIYALDELNADGIVLLASAGGKFLGDPDFEELMAELDRREAVVFVHPNIHPTSDDLPMEIPGFVLEFMVDTSRAVANLLFSGTLERYQNIKWIIAHGGATIPYLAWRLSLMNAVPGFMDRCPRGALAYLKTLHYDTALSPTAYTAASLLQLVEPTQVLFGSDFPYAPAPLVGTQVEELHKNNILDEQVMRMVMRDNALRLFPRFAGSGEMPADITSHRLQEHKKMSLPKRFAVRTLTRLIAP